MGLGGTGDCSTKRLHGTWDSEPWLSVLSELSELSEHCRALSGSCRQVTVGPVGPVGAFLTGTTCGHCQALSCTVGAVGAVGAVGLSVCRGCRTILSKLWYDCSDCRTICLSSASYCEYLFQQTTLDICAVPAESLLLSSATAKSEATGPGRALARMCAASSDLVSARSLRPLLPDNF